MKRLKIIPVLTVFSLAIVSAFASNLYRQPVLTTLGFQAGNCAAGLQNIDGGVDCNGGNTTCKVNGQTAYDSQANCQSHGTTGILKRTL